MTPAARWTLVVVCAATAILLLDVTVVNVALAQIERDLDASFDELQWVIDAYAIALAAVLLIFGSLADRIGRRRVLVAGLVVFAAASLMCALAGDPVVLDVARGIQGIGAAAMFATSLALLAQEFEGERRGFAFGVWGAVSGAAIALGPLVGGALVDAIDWEWIFLVNIPIAAVLVAVTLTRVPESKPGRPEPLDIPGAFTFAAALTLIVLGLTRANSEGWGDGLIVRRARGRSGPACRVRRTRAAQLRSDARPAPLPRPRVRGNRRGRLPPVGGDLPAVPLHVAVAPERPWLRAVRHRAPPLAVHAAPVRGRPPRRQAHAAAAARGAPGGWLGAAHGRPLDDARDSTPAPTGRRCCPACW